MANSNKSNDRRKARVRRAIAAHAGGLRPRLSVFRSSKQISAQIIDDEKGVTVAAASTLICLLLAYPVAWLIAHSPKRRRDWPLKPVTPTGPSRTTSARCWSAR